MSTAIAQREAVADVLAALDERLRADHPEIKALSTSTWLSVDGRPYVCLDMLVIDVEHRRKGVGSAIMRALLAAADEHGWTLCLSPSPIGAQPWSMSGLTRWYRSFGFLPNAGRRRDWETVEAMVRPAGPDAKPVSY